MSFKRITKTIYGDGPGQSTEFTYFRIGPETFRKKVYLQAALHADEQPGILVLHHLLDRLKVADLAGELDAEFVVVPMVNPLGMAQIQFLQHQGRYDWSSGVNFNRKWPDIAAAIKSDLVGKLNNNEAENVQIICSAVEGYLNNIKSTTAGDQLRLMIMKEAFDADYVFDLHCDNEALNHMFVVPHLMPEYKDLADWFGACGILTCEKSGGFSFDEVWPNLWLDLANEFPEYAIPTTCFAATLEYRGVYEVFDDLNQQDADNLFGFFQGRSLVRGTLIEKSPFVAPDATDLAATQMLRVESAGLLAYKVNLGDYVVKGQTVAELLKLDGEGAFTTRKPLKSGTDGVIISRNVHKYVWPGCSVAKIVGERVLSDRGDYLLED